MGFIIPDAPRFQLHLPTGAAPSARSRLPNPCQLRPPRPLPSLLSHPAVPPPSPRGAPFPPLPTHLPAPERCPPPTVPRAEALAPRMPRAASRLSSRRASRSGFPRNLLTSPITPETRNHIPRLRAREATGFSQRALRRARPHSPGSLQPWRLQFTTSTGPRRSGRLPGPAPRPGPAPGRRSLRANFVARIWDFSRAPGGSG